MGLQGNNRKDPNAWKTSDNVGLGVRLLLTAYRRVNESLITTCTAGLCVSVVPQRRLSAPPSHFKSPKLIKPFFHFW